MIIKNNAFILPCTYMVNLIYINLLLELGFTKDTTFVADFLN